MTPLADMAVYEDADFYDREFANRAHDASFFIEQAKQADGPVLEVACGTGRITLPIARAGVHITGLDVMRSMLDRARQKSLAEGIDVTWLEQDCRAIHSERRFSLVFSATNAMQHLHDLDSVNAFLGSAKRVLAPGGTLILDVFNPDIRKLARPADARYLHKSMVDTEGQDIRVEATSHYDTASQILRFELDYLREGKCVRTKRVSMRCFFPEELLALCRFNGFDVVRRLGDYDASAFMPHSPKQILFCRAA
ncbi:class I SAM-dependent methyltransferase [Ralstonia flaminis]|jgi:SAM-dependent methyltransferase|uniref:2-methoxy-6-polyprenyl-1,4-benzoquinol methylase, mitochondrial n=1 Tax=Ralstonia flaminis TaxID=3058597 RepID=A0ABN9JFD4_9RALS|nr:class I SAM-dependent methyltransferase [Ralstonia sp. LMG 18101]CAJ0809984.1 2-methoxy-6-polyprenyl-1,4-benzoquinol methylase, mitochondrial [Ralstonia sp. LMG 18101]